MLRVPEMHVLAWSGKETPIRKSSVIYRAINAWLGPWQLLHRCIEHVFLFQITRRALAKETFIAINMSGQKHKKTSIILRVRLPACHEAQQHSECPWRPLCRLSATPLGGVLNASWQGQEGNMDPNEVMERTTMRKVWEAAFTMTIRYC